LNSVNLSKTVNIYIWHIKNILYTSLMFRWNEYKYFVWFKITNIIFRIYSKTASMWYFEYSTREIHEALIQICSTFLNLYDIISCLKVSGENKILFDKMMRFLLNNKLLLDFYSASLLNNTVSLYSNILSRLRTNKSYALHINLMCY